jgi:hypothetical protein
VTYGASEVFAGEATIDDKAVGLPVELVIARAMNLHAQYWTTPRVLRTNVRAGRRYGDLAWRLRVAPGEQQVLRYTVSASEARDESQSCPHPRTSRAGALVPVRN